MSTIQEDRADLLKRALLSKAGEFKSLNELAASRKIAESARALELFLDGEPERWLTSAGHITPTEAAARLRVLNDHIGAPVREFIKRETGCTPEEYIDANASEPREKFLIGLADIGEVAQ